MAPTPVLDHIVLLLPHATLAALPPWLSDAFSVLDGGKHAGGLTENKLILFQDGVYVELIAFAAGLDEESRAKHRWGGRPEGRIIDWALSLRPETDATVDAQFQTIQTRVHLADVGAEYDNLMPGGRTTPDGAVLQWATAAPDIEFDPRKPGTAPIGGALPFWCLDRTDRALRVPYQSGSLATHPSAATGLATVALYIRDDKLLHRLRHVYDAVLDVCSRQVRDGVTNAVTYEWTLAVPEPGPHGRLPKLTLAHLDEAKLAAIAGSSSTTPADGWIELTLFTTGTPQTISGQLVDGWRIDIRLEV